MLSWILAFTLALAVWIVASLFLWFVQRRRNETERGLTLLAGMHWREFSQIVRRALREQRGLQDVSIEGEDAHSPHSDFLMGNESHRWLVSCKHGRAYRIGSAAVNELGAAARLAGARGGILITEGKVQREGVEAATKQSVEVLDGPLLWPVLKPYMRPDIQARVTSTANREALRHIAIAALGAVAIGLLAGLGHQGSRSASPSDQASVPAPVAAAPATPAPPPAAQAQPAAAPTPAPAPAPTSAAAANATPTGGNHSDADKLIGNPDEATLQRYQREVSRALAGKEGIASGVWLTRMTLSVTRTGEADDVWPIICREVTRYPALRTVRIQLNPRPGVDEPVRWRQCATM